MRELSRVARLLEPNDYRRMPWKNGLGMTTEIAVFPAQAGWQSQPFLWRVSLAEVEQSGDFSVLPGYDRSIMLSEGAGMQLCFESAPTCYIRERFRPFRFKGDWLTHCRLLDGPVRDFNVMSARDKSRHTCEVLSVSGSLNWAPTCQTLLLYCFTGQAWLEGIQIQSLMLEPCQTLVLDTRRRNPENLVLTLSAPASGMVVAVVSIYSL